MAAPSPQLSPELRAALGRFTGATATEVHRRKLGVAKLLLAHAPHFKKADKNSDGFLTKDEVGEKRWSRIQVADANKDGKVSQPEMQQAHKDGKLGHGKPSQKA
jgi:hypothetical protein